MRKENESGENEHKGPDSKEYERKEGSFDFYELGAEGPVSDLSYYEYSVEPLSPVGPPKLLLSDFFKTQGAHYEAPEQYAKETVRQYLEKKWDLFLDPDEVIIATLYVEASGRSSGPFNAMLAYSMTLTAAMMRNWQQNGSGEFLEHLSHLEPYRDGGYAVNLSPHPLPLGDCIAYEAIYRKTTPQRYDASTHLAVHADNFKQYVWDCNLQAHYNTLLDKFWEKHEASYNLLIKGSLLKAAYVQAAAGALSVEDKSMVLTALGLDAEQAWETLTYETFVDAPLLPSISFRELIIYRYIATDIMVIRCETSGRVILYIPGNSSPLHCFDSDHSAKEWVAVQCRDPLKRKALEGHFKIEDDGDGLFLSGLHAALAGLGVYPKFLNQATGYWSPQDNVKFGPALSPWPFSHLRQNLKERLASDARQAIHNRTDYWKEVAAHGITDSILVLGLVAMVAPEVGPALAAMSLALIGLGVDEVVGGRDFQERQQGLKRIEFGVLNALPIAVERVAGVVGQAVAEEAQASVVEERLSAKVQEKEEEARLLEHARLKTIDKQERNFGIEPEGLRSLRPDMRARLKLLEYDLPLTQGSWSSTNGAQEMYQRFDYLTNTTQRYIRLHSRVYRVEWVDTASQYRIVSPSGGPAPGPFVRELWPGRWDLDVKPGLRGGESFDGSMPRIDRPLSDPELPRAPIVLQPDIPKIQIDIPMDGIENAGGEYFITLKGKRTSVYYDADPDVACWKFSPIDYVWRDGMGEWQEGSAAAYKKIEGRLPASVDYQIYKFARLPRLPTNAKPIAREVHHIWMGDRLPSDSLLNTLSKNAGKSPDLKFTLHIDIDRQTALHELSARFSNHPNVHISELRNEDFYPGFLKGKNAKLFNYFRRGPYQNLAAASDVLRYRLIHEYGGIYMDCDDVIMRSFEGVALDAEPSDVLMGSQVNAPSFNYVGPATSHFASHAGNPVLAQVLDEIELRFLSEDPEFFKTPRPHMDKTTEALRIASKKKMERYMTKIFELTGPGVFSDVIRRLRPDYFDLLERSVTPDVVVAPAYTERLEAAMDFYFPFRRKAPIFAGSANEW